MDPAVIALTVAAATGSISPSSSTLPVVSTARMVRANNSASALRFATAASDVRPKRAASEPPGSRLGSDYAVRIVRSIPSAGDGA
jgi:hypothetical protein